MKQQGAAAIIVCALIGGAATGIVVRDVRAVDDPVADPSPSATATPTKKPSAPATTKGGTGGGGGDGGGGGGAPAPQESDPTTETPEEPQLQTLSSMTIGAGSIGPVAVGTTVEAAAETGYFDADVEACGGGPRWTTDYSAVLDVGSGGGVLTSLGVRAPGPRTASGLGVGSTYAAVKQVVGADVVPEAAGTGSGVFVANGDAWIGFQIEGAPEALTDTSPVTYIEVTRGSRPDLVRGC